MQKPSDTPLSTDRMHRFVFENFDIRGQTVQLTRAHLDIVDIHQYPPGVCQLMGEFLAAVVLLSGTLKFEGNVILQARSEAQVPLLMVECSNDLEVRAIARGAQEATATEFEQLLGGGQLAITIDPLEGQRYQGIVPLDGHSLAASLEHYFEQSEQLATRFWLAADDHGAAGMLLQQLPEKLTTVPEHRHNNWAHICSLANTVEGSELLQLATPQLLHRLFHEDPLRLFEPTPVRFQCSCSAERSQNALLALGVEDLESLLEERGEISIDCEFCNQQYLFARDDLTQALGADKPSTVH